MRAVFCLFLLARGDAAQAGAAYKQGLDELKRGRYEEAARKFAEALAHVPQETDKLLYRDDEGRHADPYYPHYGWAQARARQAEAEPAAGRKRRLLEEAVAHLGLSRHPSAAKALEEARATLEALDRAAAAPPPPDPAAAALAALAAKVEDLCARQRFEEAREAVESERPLAASRPRETGALLRSVADRQAAALDGYRRLMDAALETVAATDPTGKPDPVLPLVRPALVPPWVRRDPGGPFGWLAGFADLCDRERAALRDAAALDPPAALRAADAFEHAAEGAAAAGSVPGFRAARAVAHAIRWARAQTLPAEEALEFLSEGDRASERCEEALRRDRGALEAGAAERYLRTELAAQALQRAGLRRALERRAALSSRVAEAERALSRRGTMADPDALRRVSSELEALESEPEFRDLPPGVRARALLGRALAEATAEFLEGADAGRVADRCGPLARRAFALDARADEGWRGRISPKLRAVLDGLKE
jgi:hypothetical protein